MTATRKNTKSQKKRRARKPEPRFYAVRSIEKTTDNWVETLKGYNDRYVMKPFETGKDFFEDMRKDPRKVVESLFDNGKKFTKDVKKDPRKVFDGLVDDGKDFADSVRKDVRKAVDIAMDGTKDFYRAVGKDGRKLVDTLADRRKKIMERIPVISALEKGMSDGLETLPGRLNLPSKKDMDKLTKTVRTLNTRLNTLTKQYSL